MSHKKANISHLVIQCIDAMGGFASKEVILKAVSTATDKKFWKMGRRIDDALDTLIVDGVIRTHNDNYYLNMLEETASASHCNSGSDSDSDSD
uniref:DUF4777 domain-containing protein n=2 Tax=Drosophila melanogaster TaxID=7227 RepID=X2JEG4_DROME|nr:uncharacterized protein Dmel_CG45490 [Drosophila melanogaster]AHN59941.1 uncharacterized protein Dmel_CG45490 [Drosophila melanogaster]|eukprot:NP_001285471.1 uncharacterized protein Dmel_CG45490 [Drosophila melanogaster]